MARNYMVKYVGPKKRIHVPFPLDNKLPIRSMSELDEVVTFERNIMVELEPKRAEALIKQSPDVFKIVDTIKAKPIKKPEVVQLTEEEYQDVSGDTDSALEVTEPANDH